MKFFTYLGEEIDVQQEDLRPDLDRFEDTEVNGDDAYYVAALRIAENESDLQSSDLLTTH